jgi:hypothetical protein
VLARIGLRHLGGGRHDQHGFERRQVHGRPDQDVAELARASLDGFYLTDDKALRVNAINARRDHPVAGLEIGRSRHVLEPHAVAAGAQHHPLGARPFHQSRHGGVAVNDELDLGGARGRQNHPAHDAGRGDDRHVRGEALRAALVQRHGAEVGAGAAGDDRRGRGGERRLFLEVEQFLQHARLAGQRALALQRHLELRHALLEGVVLLADLPEVHVVLPDPAHLADAAGRHALHLGHRRRKSAPRAAARRAWT